MPTITALQPTVTFATPQSRPALWEFSSTAEQSTQELFAPLINVSLCSRGLLQPDLATYWEQGSWYRVLPLPLQRAVHKHRHMLLGARSLPSRILVHTRNTTFIAFAPTQLYICRTTHPSGLTSSTAPCVPRLLHPIDALTPQLPPQHTWPTGSRRPLRPIVLRSGCRSEVTFSRYRRCSMRQGSTRTGLES